MARASYEARWYPLEPEESVLDGLLRQGVAVPHACKAGVCQSCLMRVARGTVPEKAQAGLKETLKARGYFLACSYRPEAGTELEVAGAENGLRVRARLASVEPLSDDVLRVRLRAQAPFEYRAGQYLTLLRADGVARSYSLASLPREDLLELHVRLLPGGAMSGWLRDALVGEELSLQGPVGDCFYLPGRPEQPLLLAGAGTGLAPLYGIVRDALEAGHTGPVWLFHGAREPRGLYLVEALRALAERHPNLHYRPSVLEGRLGEGLGVGPLDALIRAECPKPTGWRAFLCGDPALVLSLRKKLFLAGLSLKDIHADAFLPSASAPGGEGATPRASDPSR